MNKKIRTIIIIAVTLLILIIGLSVFALSCGGPTLPAGQGIDEATAQQIALQQAGISADQATFLRTKLEMDDGRWEYEVEFFVGTQEFSYQIDASTGTIVDADSDSLFD